jgi:hypothetical protein
MQKEKPILCAQKEKSILAQLGHPGLEPETSPVK